jgi:hypothetical protein
MFHPDRAKVTRVPGSQSAPAALKDCPMQIPVELANGERVV